MYLLKLTSLFFALGLMISRLFAADAQPQKEKWDDIDTRTFQVQPFSKIHLEGAFKVIIEQGNVPGLRIKTDEENFKYIDVKSDTQSLSLKITKKHFDFEELTLYITVKELEKLEIDGGVSLETMGYIEMKDFYMHVSGGANIEMNLKARDIRLIGEGGVKYEFDGISESMDATLQGAGFFNAIDLKTKKTNIKIEGVGTGTVYATDILNVSISGIGKIRYKGEPQVFKKIEGIGIVSTE